MSEDGLWRRSNCPWRRHCESSAFRKITLVIILKINNERTADLSQISITLLISFTITRFTYWFCEPHLLCLLVIVRTLGSCLDVISSDGALLCSEDWYIPLDLIGDYYLISNSDRIMETESAKIVAGSKIQYTFTGFFMHEFIEKSKRRIAEGTHNTMQGTVWSFNTENHQTRKLEPTSRWTTSISANWSTLLSSSKLSTKSQQLLSSSMSSKKMWSTPSQRPTSPQIS